MAAKGGGMQSPFALLIGIDIARYPHIQIDETTQKYPLTRSNTVVGHGDKADIRIEDLGADKSQVTETICEEHALIRYDKPSNELTITDLTDFDG
eukprot:CAMPEP_0197611782 /NCGR_PEP_ID=MMETSP1326-20131121/56042_1 /TAXON_ID=1155430 /ORGANISM="Genus nov. species nov., Strain RCC2288" /LENGTH=94 /DNA_ID=CAMNT_0043180469 /DNA_START=93 /DNA_END=373 /DNA_ORIENTATION=-